MSKDFHPWRTGLAMTAATLIIVIAWALADMNPWKTFASLLRFAVLPLLLPLIDNFVRFLADIARWAWLREDWRAKPHSSQVALPVETNSPSLVPTPSFQLNPIAYTVMGRPQPSLARPTADEQHQAAWRECCLAFLQAGGNLRNSKGELGDWTIRAMVDAGVVSDPEWRLITSVLAGAGLMTTKGGARPYPDYRGALVGIRHGKPLPLPKDPAPRITRQHTQHNPHTLPAETGEASSL